MIRNDSKKLRLVNVWATWCGPCVIEFPDLVSLHRIYRGRDFDEAVALLRESLAIAERLYPDGHPEASRRFGTMTTLAGVLATQAKALLPTDRERALALFQEAEPLLSAGFTGMGEGRRSRPRGREAPVTRRPRHHGARALALPVAGV